MVNKVNSSLNLNINNTLYPINSIHIPDFQTLFDTFKEPLHSDALIKPVTLSDRCCSLKSLYRDLQDSKRKSIQDKIFAFLKSTLLVGVLAGSILGFTLASGGAAIGIGLGALAVYMFLSLGVTISHMNVEQQADYLASTNLCSPCVSGFIAPFIPIYAAFTKIPALERKVESEKHSLEIDLSAAVNFYKNNHESEQQKIDKHLESVKADLLKAESKKEWYKIDKCISSMRSLEEKKVELKKVHVYFSNF